MNVKTSFILALLITLLIANFFYFSKGFNEEERQSVLVTRIVDGDTFESGDNVYRLVNINTPEKNERGYGDALSYLKTFENETVEIEVLGLDKYSRTLVRVYSPDYLNLELVEKGLAKKFLVQKEELKTFSKAEENAINAEVGIWEKSEYFSCFDSEITEEKEEIILKNLCSEIILKDWIITDESRKKYKFENLIFNEAITLYSGEGEDENNRLYWGSGQDIWNNDRDTLYLFDNKGKIAHHNSYGY